VVEAPAAPFPRPTNSSLCQRSDTPPSHHRCTARLCVSLYLDTIQNTTQNKLQIRDFGGASLGALQSNGVVTHVGSLRCCSTLDDAVGVRAAVDLGTPHWGPPPHSVASVSSATPPTTTLLMCSPALLRAAWRLPAGRAILCVVPAPPADTKHAPVLPKVKQSNSSPTNQPFLYR
jgi:hypothetical protein